MSDQSSTITNIVFIDAAVPDYQTLIEGLPNNSTYFVLDAQKDGIEQIEQALAGYSKLDSIQILSHGSQGSLYLGNAVLSNNTLKQYQDQLANIGSHLKDTGDILLYGCNVAQGDTGLQFIDALAKATGADVAASNDITGSAALGGDWVLEENVGIVDTIILSEDNFQSILSSTGGIVKTDFGGDDWATVITLDNTGKIIEVGSVWNSNDSKYDFGLVRYNGDGSLDITFGDNGKVSTSFGGQDTPFRVTVQKDGKILVVGASEGGHSYFVLARYNMDGSLDSSFGVQGKVLTSFEGIYNYGHGLAVQNDGKIITGGYTHDPSTNKLYFTLARYNIDGSLDVDFDNDGKVTTDFLEGNYDSAYDLTLQVDGKIVLVGSTYNSVTQTNYFAIARYNLDGSLDNSFDNDGKVTTEFTLGGSMAQSITIQDDGKIIVVGSASSDLAMARYNIDGSLDVSFGINGRVTKELAGYEDGQDVLVQPDEKILVVVEEYNFTTQTYYGHL